MEQSTDINPTILSLRETGKFSKLILDLEEGGENLRPFIGQPSSLKGFKQKIEERKQFPTDRDLLVDSLNSQYEGFEINPSVQAKIESLSSENTFTVTTGHQLNIFTGPLYFHYKILSTIKLAEQLAIEFPEYKFVPIYWMNSEDHDLDEVGQVNLFGTKYRWETEQSGATGRMATDGLADLADELDEKLRSPEAKELLQVFKRAYETGKSLTQATRSFVNHLYGNQGLVIIDSDDSKLKASFQSMVEAELSDQILHKPIEASSRELESGGYHAQVNPRPINFFLLNEEGRNLIEFDGNRYSVRNTEIIFSKKEMLEQARSQPESISYNVVSRPLFQEFLLPNLAYIGGGGELAYWLQYKEMFADQTVSYPILVLRDSFLMIDSKSAKIMEENELPVKDLFQDEELLINSILKKSNSEELDLELDKNSLNEFYDSLSTKAETLDKGLKSGVEAERAKQLKSLANWEGKFRKAVKLKSESHLNRVRKTHQQLFPNGGLQERSMNILEAFERFGPDFLIQTKAHEEPLSTNKFAVVRF